MPKGVRGAFAPGKTHEEPFVELLARRNCGKPTHRCEEMTLLVVRRGRRQESLRHFLCLFRFQFNLQFAIFQDCFRILYGEKCRRLGAGISRNQSDNMSEFVKQR